MPIEKRDPVSNARLFIPTSGEKAIRQSQHILNKEINEVRAIKEELLKLVEEAKNK